MLGAFGAKGIKIDAKTKPQKTKKRLTVRVEHDKLIKSPKQGDEKFFEN